MCSKCEKYFANYSCGAWRGECDCPKCQGTCECSTPIYDPDEITTVISENGIEHGFIRGNTIHIVDGRKK